jgi:hypothetical protein
MHTFVSYTMRMITTDIFYTAIIGDAIVPRTEVLVLVSLVLNGVHDNKGSERA